MCLPKIGREHCSSKRRKNGFRKRIASGFCHSIASAKAYRYALITCAGTCCADNSQILIGINSNTGRFSSMTYQPVFIDLPTQTCLP